MKMNFKKVIKQVAKMNRNELLQNSTRENKDPHTILDSTLHPKLNNMPSFLKNNFHLISNDPKLSKISKQRSTVFYRKSKSLSDCLMKKNNFANQQLHCHVSPYGKNKLCLQINTGKRKK